VEKTASVAGASFIQVEMINNHDNRAKVLVENQDLRGSEEYLITSESEFSERVNE
jgi:hypothetical protein